MSEKASREITPADLKVLEPDVLGVLSLVVHGRDEPPKPQSWASSAPAGWRGLGRRWRPR